MKVLIVVGLPIVFLVLLAGVVLFISKKLKDGTIGPGMAKTLALIAVLILAVLFIFLMGVLKTLQG